MPVPIVQSRPLLPDEEAYRAGRPAAGVVAQALAAAASHTLGVVALRTGVQQWQMLDYTTGGVLPAAETRRVLYRPSPLAAQVWVGVWFTAAYPFGATAPAAPSKIQLTLLDDATLTPQDTAALDDIQQQDRPRGSIIAAGGNIDDTGLMQGLERLAALAWSAPLDASTLAGLDGWISVEATEAAILAVQWVEVVPAEGGV